MAAELLTGLGRAVVDLLFSPRCVLCGGGGSFLCGECAASLPRALPPRCPQCWQPMPSDELCPDCLEETSHLESIRSAFVYKGPVRELVHALKYNGQTCLVGPMAHLLAAKVGRQVDGIDLVAPVPLFGRRRRTRGYNQSALLARELGKTLSVPVVEDALVRLRNTPSQAKLANAGERRKNVQGAFECRDRRVAGRLVLLVDDVTTTGATLEACAAALTEAGAARVRAVTFARED